MFCNVLEYNVYIYIYQYKYTLHPEEYVQG